MIAKGVNYRIEPMTLGDMRQLGVRSLDVRACLPLDKMASCSSAGEGVGPVWGKVHATNSRRLRLEIA
jgi:hypothetical protein